MNLGDLTVFIKANVTDGLKGIQSFSQGVRELADQVKRAGGEFARAGAAITAMAAGALALAAQHSSAAHASLENIERSSIALAMQLSKVLTPAFREVATLIQNTANVLASLSPQTRTSIGHFVELASAVGVGAKAMSMIAGVVAGLASAVSLIAGAIVPLLAIVAALTLIVSIVALVHRAWRTNFLGIQGVVHDVAQFTVDAFHQAFEFLETAWDAFIGSWQQGIQTITEGIATVLDQLAMWSDELGSVAKMLAALPHMGALAGIGDSLKGAADSMRGGAGGARLVGMAGVAGLGLLSSSNLPNTIISAAHIGAEAFKNTGAAILDELKQMFPEVGKLIDDLKSRFSGAQGVAPRYGDLDHHLQPGAISRDLLGILADMELAGLAAQHKSETRIGGISNGSAVLDPLTKSSILQSQAADLNVTAFDRLWNETEGLLGAVGATGRALKAFTQQQLAMFGQAIGQAGQNFANKLGDLGSTITAGVSGAQSGGAFGAVFGVLIELFSKASQFQSVLSTAQGQFLKSLQELAPTFTTLASSLVKFMGGVSSLATALHSIAEPILNALSSSLTKLAPNFVVLGMALGAMAPAIQALVNVFQAISPNFRILFEVSRALGLVIAGFALGVESIWNLIVNALYTLVQDIASALGANWDSLLLSISGMAVQTQPAIDALNQLMNTSYDAASATAANAGAQLDAAGAAADAAKTLDSFNEQLLNVPSGFKVGAARFNAQDPAAQGFTGVTGGPGVFVNGDMHVTTASDDLANTLVRKAKRQRFQRTGSSQSK